MKYHIKVLACILFMVIRVYAQNVNSTYFLDKWSQRNNLNPAFIPANGQISLPLIGGFEFYSSSNTGLSNFIYPYNTELVTFLHSSVDGNEFINRLDPNVYLNQSLNLNLLSAGLFIDKNYISFGINLKEKSAINLPLDLFKFMKLGFVSQNNVYDLKNIRMEQSNIIEYSLGYSHPLNSKLRIGLHAKYLVGISKFNLQYSKFDVLLSGDRYEIDAIGDMELMSDLISLKTNENNIYQFQNYNLNFVSQNPAGHGFALDFGAEYKPVKNLTLAVALNNIGFVNWNTKSLQKGIAKTNVVFSGFTIDNIEDINIDRQLAELTDDLKKLIHFKQVTNNLQVSPESTPYTMNFSVEYSLFGEKERDITIGLLWNSYNSNNIHKNILMSAVTFKPVKWFSLSTTYALISKDTDKLGLAVNYSPEWVNFFVAADYITTKINRQFIPINKFSMNLQAGVSFYLGK